VCCITLQRLSIPIAVAEDECGGQSGQKIQDLLRPYVAAVKIVFRTTPPQQLNCFAGGVEPVVRIAEDSDDHARQPSRRDRDCTVFSCSAGTLSTTFSESLALKRVVFVGAAAAKHDDEAGKNVGR
jgi:hypothetical protein